MLLVSRSNLYIWDESFKRSVKVVFGVFRHSVVECSHIFVVLLTFFFAFRVFFYDFLAHYTIQHKNLCKSSFMFFLHTKKKSQDEDNLMRVRCHHRFYVCFFPFYSFDWLCNFSMSLSRAINQTFPLQLQSDTLNPFEVNGQIFNGNACDSEKELSSDKEKKDDENNVVLTNEQVALLQDQRQELSDLRRQVVYLQVRLHRKN